MQDPSPGERLLPSLLLAALIGPAAAGGQVLTTLEFSFSNPGARSLGFGGAFVALADDATAAFANPAGLVQLARPEVSIAGRSWSYSSPYAASGRAAGQPTGIGLDTVAGPLLADSEAELSGLSFIAVVYPRGSWSFAFYQHQLQNFEMTQETQGIFIPGPVAGAWRSPIERGLFDFEITSRAVAVAYRVSERLSLGVGLSNFEPSSRLVGSDYLPDDDTLEAYFAPASFLPDRLLHVVGAETRGSDWGLAAGLLWRLSPQWSLGGAYREGPRFVFGGELVAGPAHPDMPPGFRVVFDPGTWAFPDVYSAGGAYRTRNGRWTGSLEWSRVEYSTIQDSLDPRLKTPGDVLDDADELHLGGEVAFFVGRSVIALRLGAWHDPDHQVRNVTGSALNRAEAPGGADELHLAAGFGVARDAFQLDLGIDLSERRDTASLSVIYSF